MMDNFAGTADYYDTFRPGVTPEVIETVLTAAPDRTSLLDLGCGTGRITEQFAGYFRETLALEPDHEMIKRARQRLQGQPVTFIQSSAEEVTYPDDWRASVVTIVRAFHWMNRELVVRKLEPIVSPEGIIAVIWDYSFWHSNAAWAQASRAVIQHYLGKERQTAHGAYQKPTPFEAAFEGSAFPHLQSYSLPVSRVWTADQIIGYLYSTSFASKALLGDKTKPFEEHLRRELASLSPNDTFTEDNTFTILLARRA